MSSNLFQTIHFFILIFHSFSIHSKIAFFPEIRPCWKKGSRPRQLTIASCQRDVSSWIFDEANWNGKRIKKESEKEWERETKTEWMSEWVRERKRRKLVWDKRVTIKNKNLVKKRNVAHRDKLKERHIQKERRSNKKVWSSQNENDTLNLARK